MKGARFLSAVALAALFGPTSAGAAEAETGEELVARGAVDHHVHLLGPDLLRDWRLMGVTFSKPDDTYLTARSVLGPPGPVGPESAVERAVLVPMAHFYGDPELRAAAGLSLDQERERVARENDHVAREAARYPGRAMALCSASVLRPYARAELERCHAAHSAAGIKIHVGSSGVDLRDPAHLETLAGFAAWAERERLPVLLHLDPQRRGTTVADVDRFAKIVLEPHPELTVLVAHLGGSGGYGPWTRSVFQTLTAWRERVEKGEKRPRRLYFDLSAVLLEKPSEGVPATTPEEARTLAADLRATRFDRIVLGSDAPVFTPQGTVQALRTLAGLTPEELRTIVTRAVPGFFEPSVAPALGK